MREALGYFMLCVSLRILCFGSVQNGVSFSCFIAGVAFTVARVVPAEKMTKDVSRPISIQTVLGVSNK